MSVAAWAVLERRASRRFGVFTLGDAVAAGLSAQSLTRAVGAGRVERIHRGVYRFVAVRETARAQVMAAALAAGDGFVVSHETAAGLWGIGDLRLVPPYHMSSTERCQRSIGGVQLHMTSVLPRLDRTYLGPFPITMVRRTIVDLSGRIEVDVLEDLLIEAVRRGLADVAGIDASLSALPDNVAGGAALRRLLRSLDADEVRRLLSRLEAHFLRLVRRVGLPVPRVNRRLLDTNGNLLAKVDFIWEHARLVVEIDGLRWHSTPSQKAYDDDRQNEIVLSGYRVLRYGARKLLRDPRSVTEQLRRALADPPLFTDA